MLCSRLRVVRHPTSAPSGRSLRFSPVNSTIEEMQMASVSWKRAHRRLPVMTRVGVMMNSGTRERRTEKSPYRPAKVACVWTKVLLTDVLVSRDTVSSSGCSCWPSLAYSLAWLVTGSITRAALLEGECIFPVQPNRIELTIFVQNHSSAWT